MSDRIPHVVIVGGGFGGLAAAKALKPAPVRVTLVDHTNVHPGSGRIDAANLIRLPEIR